MRPVCMVRMLVTLAARSYGTDRQLKLAFRRSREVANEAVPSFNAHGSARGFALRARQLRAAESRRCSCVKRGYRKISGDHAFARHDEKHDEPDFKADASDGCRTGKEATKSSTRFRGAHGQGSRRHGEEF